MEEYEKKWEGTMASDTKNLGLEESIIEISDLFYQNKNSEGVKQLPNLISQLASYAGSLSADQVPGYTGVLKSIMEAMDMQNYILLADLLIYEVMPFLQ